MPTTSSTIETQVGKRVPRFLDSAWDDRRGVAITAALASHDEDEWVTNAVFVDAMACWVIHDLLVGEQADNPTLAHGSGPIQSIRTGDESISFVSPSGQGAADEVYFRATSYGRRYLMYRNSRPAAHLFLVV